MSSRAMVACLTLFLVGCPRDVTVDIYHPDECASGCPLESITHFETRLVRVDGTLVELDGCQEAPEDLCEYSELANVVFVDNISRPADAIEIVIDGISGEDCDSGQTVFRCESFGDTVVDLELDTRVPIWCSCPLE